MWLYLRWQSSDRTETQSHSWQRVRFISLQTAFNISNGKGSSTALYHWNILFVRLLLDSIEWLDKNRETSRSKTDIQNCPFLSEKNIRGTCAGSKPLAWSQDVRFVKGKHCWQAPTYNTPPQLHGLNVKYVLSESPRIKNWQSFQRQLKRPWCWLDCWAVRLLLTDEGIFTVGSESW